jgi:hypothetical protein
LRPGGRFVIVPEARLTGRGPTHRFLEWLYAITGQRRSPAAGTAASQSGRPVPGTAAPQSVHPVPGTAAPQSGRPVLPDTHPWREYGRRFTDAGFSVQAVPIEQAKSRVTVVVALKV